MSSRTTIVVFLVLCLWLASALGETGEDSLVTIGSLNLEDFGYGKSSCKSELLDQIAEELQSYSVVALQEVMRVSAAGSECYKCSWDLCHLDKLVRVLEDSTDKDWDHRELGPYKYGPRYEYYVFLYCKDIVTYLEGSLGSAEDVMGPDYFKVRPPAFAGFKCGNFDFVLVNYHAPSRGSSVSTYEEVAKLDDFLDTLQASNADEDDIILLGDLNLESPEGMFVTESPLDWVIDCPTTSGDKAYDKISYYCCESDYEYSGESGVDDLPILTDISNHALVWARFQCNKPDDD